jgi:hypothetical protein
VNDCGAFVALNRVMLRGECAQEVCREYQSQERFESALL